MRKRLVYVDLWLMLIQVISIGGKMYSRKSLSSH